MENSRIRRVRPTARAAKGATQEMLDLLKSISKMQAEEALLKSRISAGEVTLFDAMRRAKLTHIEVSSICADIVTTIGNTSNTVDPKGLRARLPDDKEYYDCISVSITKAKQYLGEKELAKITKSIPGKPKDPVLKITTAKR